MDERVDQEERLIASDNISGKPSESYSDPGKKDELFDACYLDS
jgi:hypothetical protein